MNFINKYIVVVLVLLPFVALSSLEYNNTIYKVHQELLNLNFEEAERLINIEGNKNPENRYVDYFKSYRYFLKAYFDAEKLDYEHFVKASDICLEMLGKEKDTEKALILSANISIQRAFIFFLWSEHMSYVRALMQGQSYIDAIDKKTLNVEYLKIRSVYEVLGGSIPNRFKTYAQWFNIKGSATKGIELITTYLEKVKKASPRQLEGQIINLYLRNFVDLPNVSLTSDSSNLLTYVYLQTGKEKAISKIERIDNLNSASLPDYFTFLKAKFYLELQKKEGLALMDRFVNRHKGIGLVHSARYYKAWYYCSNQKMEKYSEESAQIKDLKPALFPFDKKVISRLENKSCNSYLSKARMLFDAGEFNTALRILKRPNVVASLIDFNQKIEYLYRLARIYENINKIDRALELYQKVIDTKKSELYFVAFSAYRIGKIYTWKQEKQLAERFFNIALKLNDGEYKSSIESKCQYAIENLK